ncbi:trimeric porin PorB [Neisseria canis]|uniref:Porin n=2 Tax=Neisseria canis TaxID=493 RepID=A0A1X3CW41_9NEIS|nr:trimeric porin PorB [Neisseria canis]OSI11732.1 hypothetical protein BWD07_08890 [Neisseria canis]VEF01361.1 porin [Neisseria canis]
MKKTLIALSLVALSGAASAEVILYGQIKAGVEVAQVKHRVNGVSEKDYTETKITDFGSRIGFKGTEHLGSGLNAIWQLEQNASVAGTDSGWGTRDSFIGLEGETWGKFRAGKLSTQLKDMDALDPWEYKNPALGLGVFERTGKRVISARYDSPVWAGFSFNAQFTPRDNQTNTGRDDDVVGRQLSDTSAYYAGLNYENAGFFAQYGVGYKKAAYVANNDSKSAQAHKVEAGYDANNLFVGLGYQYTNGWDSENSYRNTIAGIETDANVTDTSGRLKTHEAALTTSYTFGNVTPRLSYAHGFKAKSGGNKVDGTNYKQVVLGADYDFSKRTTAMVSAGWLKAGSGDNKTENTAGLVGLRHKF